MDKRSILYKTIQIEDDQLEQLDQLDHLDQEQIVNQVEEPFIESSEVDPQDTSCAIASGEATPRSHNSEIPAESTITPSTGVLETNFDVPDPLNYLPPGTPIPSAYTSRLPSPAISTRKELQIEAARRGSALVSPPVLESFSAFEGLQGQYITNKMPDFADHKLKCVSAVVVVFLAIVTGVVMSSLHKIEEGNVGIYYKYGALMEATTGPGVHYMAPFVVDVKEILIRPQTTTIDPIMTITKDGIQVNFIDVQVISRVKQKQLVEMIRTYGVKFRGALIEDRVREELRKFCANHTIDDVYKEKFLEIAPHVQSGLIDQIERLGNGGLEVLNLVIPKPDIPADIASNYKQVKVQWTKQLAEIQQQKTETIKKETEKLKALADAERTKAVLEINIQQSILEREGNQNISRIENQIRKEKEESIADIAKYKATKEAEANTLLYTDQYVQLEMAKALTENTKVYFSGQNSELGAIMSKLFKTET